MDYAGNVAEDRQQDVNPKVFANPNLQEYAQGWEKYRDDDTQQIHLISLYQLELPSYYAVYL
jgi:hypothetical protein